MSNRICICGDLESEHDRAIPPGACSHINSDGKECRCLFFEPKDWLDEFEEEVLDDNDAEWEDYFADEFEETAEDQEDDEEWLEALEEAEND